MNLIVPTTQGTLDARPARADEFDAIMAVERASFESPWTPRELRDVLRLSGTECYVAAGRGHNRHVVAGFVVWRPLPAGTALMNLAVLPAYRRQQVGSMLLASAILLGTPKNHLLGAWVSEYNVAAQQFFKARGLRCDHTERDKFDRGHDGYLFSCQRVDGRKAKK